MVFKAQEVIGKKLMKITSKDILEAVINKTISIQEAKFLLESGGVEVRSKSILSKHGVKRTSQVTENYNDQWMSDDNFAQEPEDDMDMTVDHVRKLVTDKLVDEEGWRHEDVEGVLDQIADRDYIRQRLEGGEDAVSLAREFFDKTISIQEAKLGKSKITMNDINHAYESKIITSKEAQLLVEEYGQKDGMCPDCGCKLEADGHCAMCDKQY